MESIHNSQRSGKDKMNVYGFFNELGIPKEFIRSRRGPISTTLDSCEEDCYRVTVPATVFEKYVSDDVRKTIFDKTSEIRKKYDVRYADTDFTYYSMRSSRYPTNYVFHIGIYKDREAVMESIYEQMNKIDDNKSLNEKWNVKNQRKLKKLKENFTVRQYALDWDGEYDCAEEESFDTMDEAQIRFDELKEMIDNGEFDYAAVALVDENDNEISIYGEPERQKITKEDVIKYLRDKEKVRLTDQEFDYVVEDLWDAISWEMREGAIYETIDDVDMVELIDAADNPTHDLCYKLMGLLDDEKLE